MLKKLTFQRWLLLIVAGLFFLNTSAFSQNREIAGSVTSSSLYEAGTTMDLNFTVTVSSPDWEWLEELTLVFPADVTINSASTCRTIKNSEAAAQSGWLSE